MILLSIGIITFYSYIVYTQPASASGGGMKKLDFDNKKTLFSSYFSSVQIDIPEDGYLNVLISAYRASAYAVLNGATIAYARCPSCSDSHNDYNSIPVKKGDILVLSKSGSSASSTVLFIPYK